MAPLRREWEGARQEIEVLLEDDDDTAARNRLEAFQQRLAGVKVLGPGQRQREFSLPGTAVAPGPGEDRR